MSKSDLIFRDIVFKYHPLFQKPALKAAARSNPQIFDLTSLVEECFAIVGGYKVTNGSGCDFSDGSDSKTITLNSRGKSNSLVGNITSVQNKIGDLRVVIYVPGVNNLFFMVIPKEYHETNSNATPSQGYKNRNIPVYFNLRSKSFTKLEPFLVESFEDCARKSGKVAQLVRARDR